jgi:hypothetical protein
MTEQLAALFDDDDKKDAAAARGSRKGAGKVGAKSGKRAA